MSNPRNFTASQEARRRARPHELARAERGSRFSTASADFGEGETARKFVLEFWRGLDREQPGGLTCLDVARVAVERWGEVCEPALWRTTFDLIAAGLLRQVGQRIVRDRGQVVNLPIFVPSAKWSDGGRGRD